MTKFSDFVIIVTSQILGRQSSDSLHLAFSDFGPALVYECTMCNSVVVVMNQSIHISWCSDEHVVELN